MDQSEIDCFPQVVASIPIEHLSLNQHMADDWPLELGRAYESDISFLFTCNELGVTPSESSSSSATASATATAATTTVEHFNPHFLKGAEQYRRFSLEETDTLGNLMPSYQAPVYNNKERASMPNVFEQFSIVPAQQQEQISWQQHTSLQRKPDYQDVASSVSSPLKKHAKKRSLVEQVLEEEYNPSVASSLSEPIPTSQQWMIRKRNKSIRHSNTNKMDSDCYANVNAPTTTAAGIDAGVLNTPEYIVPSSTPIDSDVLPQQQPYHHQQQQHQNYIISSDSMLHYGDINASVTGPTINENNQLLAAMPRKQKLRYDGDNYTPKWVRFTGHLKEGYCDSCQPGKWLQLKNSAYWYHKQFYHGISSVSGKSFIKPLEQRIGKGDMIEGLCHQCHRFVSACNGKKKNNYMLWYRHAHKCHLYDKPKATVKNIRQLSSDSSALNISPDMTTTSKQTTKPSPSTASPSSTLYNHQQDYLHMN
ncbi:hypothetical protein [Parasitella parasitica]|uniref:Transcription regulator Rua1 C-terminal domain-containing protein n=1 Tax=Parasitella parasitica TaxID=35722 RepID=A0A0B7ND67_9FUNG|nr:hypothetical protein [Parasitella parasitica]